MKTSIDQELQITIYIIQRDATLGKDASGPEREASVAGVTARRLGKREIFP